MPLYEYQCPKCHAEFELLIFGDQKPVCPECGSSKVSRQMSVPAGHVKSDGGCAPSVTNCGHGSCCAGCHKN